MTDTQKRKEEIQLNLSKVESHYSKDHIPCLVHVTKTRPIEDIQAAYELGVRDFGENRVDELLDKANLSQELGLDDIRWHFLGNLQSNKLNRLLGIKNLKAIHSIDSFKLMKSIFDRFEKIETTSLDLFIQVNTSKEVEKSGVRDWEELSAMATFYNEFKAASKSHSVSKLKWHGLMTMSKLRTDSFEEDAHKCFSKLVETKEKLESHFNLAELKLSMGMSGDYPVALEMNSDYLRIGSLIYKAP